MTNPSPTQEVERLVIYRCPHCGGRGVEDKLQRRHGGPHCWCKVTSGSKGDPTRCDRIEVLAVEDHQRLLRAEVEKREEAQATIRRMDAANVAALESVDAWDDPSGFNGVVSNIKRLGERAKAAESRLSSVEAELERQANSEEVVYTTNRQGARDALQLLRDKNTAPNAIHEEAEPGSSSSPITGGTEQGGGDGD